MSITLDLSQEEELLLRQAAQAAGSRDVVAYIRQQVFAALPASSPAQDADTSTLDFLRSEGRTATRTAREDLLAGGIGYVYATDTALIRHHPDGTEELLAAGSTA